MNRTEELVPPEELARALAGDWPVLDAWWPLILARVLKAVDSPARPKETVREFSQDPCLSRLARDWPGLGPAARKAAWEDLAERLTRAAYATRPRCLRCGRCCRTGSPALLVREAELIRPGGPFFGQAYTIRRGEPVADRRAGLVRPADRELIKLLEPGGTCCLYDPQEGCRAYDHRPSQCRDLACWEPGGGPGPDGLLLDRALLFREDRLRLDYVLAQQKSCPADRLVPLAREAGRGSREARERLARMTGFDMHIRLFSAEKGHLDPREADLVLGRPLGLILRSLGLEFREPQDPPRA